MVEMFGVLQETIHILPKYFCNFLIKIGKNLSKYRGLSDPNTKGQQNIN